MYQSIPRLPIPPPGKPRAFDLHVIPYRRAFEERTIPDRRGIWSIKYFWSADYTKNEYEVFVVSSHNFFPLSSPLPLYKVWGEDGAKRKAVVAQDFNDFVLKGKRRNLYINLWEQNV